VKRRRKAWTLIVLAIAAGAGVWLYQNASIERLRRGFVPWMHRLERWRDAIEETRRRLRRREPSPSDPAGLERVRQWAWAGLDRMAWIEYRVEKPHHEISDRRESTCGRVRFTLGGFRPGGARVERAADVVVCAAWDPRRDPSPLTATPQTVPESVPVPMDISATLDRVMPERVNAISGTPSPDRSATTTPLVHASLAEV